MFNSQFLVSLLAGFLPNCGQEEYLCTQHNVGEAWKHKLERVILRTGSLCKKKNLRDLELHPDVISGPVEGKPWKD